MSRKDAMIRAAREGRLQSLGGRHLLVGGDLLEGLYEVLSDAGGQEGTTAGRLWERAGRGWGDAFTERLEGEASRFEASLQDLPLEDLLWLLEDALARGGWGHITWDLDTHGDQGLVLATIRGGPASEGSGALSEGIAQLLAGFCAGVLGRVSEVPMAGAARCHLIDGATVVGLAVAHRDRMEILRGALAEGVSWEHALTRAAQAGG